MAVCSPRSISLLFFSFSPHKPSDSCTFPLTRFLRTCQIEQEDFIILHSDLCWPWQVHPPDTPRSIQLTVQHMCVCVSVINAGWANHDVDEKVMSWGVKSPQSVAITIYPTPVASPTSALHKDLPVRNILFQYAAAVSSTLHNENILGWALLVKRSSTALMVS